MDEFQHRRARRIGLTCLSSPGCACNRSPFALPSAFAAGEGALVPRAMQQGPGGHPTPGGQPRLMEVILDVGQQRARLADYDCWRRYDCCAPRPRAHNVRRRPGRPRRGAAGWRPPASPAERRPAGPHRGRARRCCNRDALAGRISLMAGPRMGQLGRLACVPRAGPIQEHLRRLASPAAFPVRAEGLVPWWAVFSARLAPVLLIGAWLAADAVQPASYSPIRQTISVLAGDAATDRWIMTGTLFVVGGCYLVTAAGRRRRPCACPHPAGRLGPGHHRHRRIAGTCERPDSAAPRLDRPQRGHHRGLARPRRQAPAAATFGPEQLWLSRRDRGLRCPARLALHRSSRRRGSGPG